MKTCLFIILILVFSTSTAQQYKVFRECDGISKQQVYSISLERSGLVVFNGSKGWDRWDGKKWSHLNLGFMPNLLKKNFPQIISNTDGHVLIRAFDNDSIELNSFGIDTKIDGYGNLWYHLGYFLPTIYKIVGKEWIAIGEIPLALDINDDPRMFIDSKNNVWIPNRKGVFLCSENTIINFSKSKNLKINYCTFMEDVKGNIWISTPNNGIYKYNGGILTQYTEKDGLFSDHVCLTTIDNNGNIWAAHYKGGVSFFDGTSWSNHKFEGKYKDATRKGGLVQVTNFDLGGNWFRFPSRIIADGLNNIWYACEGIGLFKFNDKEWELVQQITDYSSFDIIKDSKGNIWFTNYATTDTRKPIEGLFKFDIKNQTWNSILKENIHNLFDDQKGNIWGTCPTKNAGGTDEIYSFANN
jgi:hypothetical protein